MNPKLTRLFLFPVIITSLIIVESCTRNEVLFGSVPDEGYTKLISVDSVGIEMATVFRDSFETNNITSYLIGRYRDPYLGTVSGKVYSQFTIPSEKPDIPTSAIFDSFTLLVRLNKYYYGDTTQPLNFRVQELAQPILHTYSSFLYNTSQVAVKPAILGQRQIRIRPTATDSFYIRLDDAKGRELLAKLQQEATELSDEANFLNYMQGLRIDVDDADLGAVFGFRGSAGDIIIRLHYHHTFPYPEDHYVDFTSLANDLAFNQLTPDRSGTGLNSTGGYVTEIPSAQTDHLAFMQAGMRMRIKLTFPTLRSLLYNNNLAKLLKAELILRPEPLSYTNDMYRLPSKLYLTTTDITNVEGQQVYDSSGSSLLQVDPVIDAIYGENTYYRFNITPYINSLLTTAGTEQSGFFLNHEDSTSNLSRLVLNDRWRGNQSSQLVLSMLIINDKKD